MRPRLHKVRERLKELKIEGLLISSSENCFYISGFRGSKSILLISEEKAILVTDSRYREQAEREAPNFEIVEQRAGETIGEILNFILSKLKIKQLGFEAEHISFKRYQEFMEKAGFINFIPLEGVVEEFRTIKDKEEIALIREAVAITDRVFDRVLRLIKPGLKERDLATEIEYLIRKEGGERSAFEIIVASGFRSSMPHARASDKVIENGNLVKMDFGALYQGYNSDLTRTVVLGRAEGEQRRIYEIVLAAQKAAFKGLRPGIKCSELDSLARGFISQAGYGDYFLHRLGHGIGCAIHEDPVISQTNEKVIEPQMVFTVEPGIYISGYGGVRIEDVVVVTDSEGEVLTKAPKELFEL